MYIIETTNIGMDFIMRTTSPPRPRAKRSPALHGACEESARSVILRVAPGKPSHEAITDMVDSLTSVIERTTELLLAGKNVRVVEDDEAMTTQEAANLLNVSRPHLVKLLAPGKIPQLPTA